MSELKINPNSPLFDWDGWAENEIIRLRASNARLLAALKRIAGMTCGCMSNTDDNWHHDKCWKAIALAAIAEAEKP